MNTSTPSTHSSDPDDLSRSTIERVRRAVAEFHHGIPEQWELQGRKISEPGVFAFLEDGASCYLRTDATTSDTLEGLADSIRGLAGHVNAVAVVMVAQARCKRAGNPGDESENLFAVTETATDERTVRYWPIEGSGPTASLGEETRGGDSGAFAEIFSNLIPKHEDRKQDTKHLLANWAPKRLTWTALISEVQSRVGAQTNPTQADRVRKSFAGDHFDLFGCRSSKTGGLDATLYFKARPSGQMLTVRVGGPTKGAPTIDLKRYASLDKLLKRDRGLREIFEEYSEGLGKHVRSSVPPSRGLSSFLN